ncbi:uncharacterized protein LOC144567180 [Carex rostrata]
MGTSNYRDSTNQAPVPHQPSTLELGFHGREGGGKREGVIGRGGGRGWPWQQRKGRGRGPPVFGVEERRGSGGRSWGSHGQRGREESRVAGFGGSAGDGRGEGGALLDLAIKGEIEHLVDPAQTGFVRGRQITEGFLYAQQTLHQAEQQDTPIGIFKADIHKAFDTVSWEFLIAILHNLGFPTNWLAWIQNAVLKGSSQVIINGLLGKRIELKRGVRQGDPLSPFLFIMAMDFLTRWLSKLVLSGAWILPYANMKPCLLYADDAMIFFKPETRSIQMIKIVFTIFKQISGLAISFQKSEIAMVRIQQEQATQLASQMGCQLAKFPITYLGLPLSSKRLTRTAYHPLIQRFYKRLEGWAAKLLSIAGRLVLINGVLSALPVYYMSCFKIPIWVIQEIDKIRRNFLWHGVSSQRKMHLVNWELVCTPKKLGGLGVMDLRTFNGALLLKWNWKWVIPANSLLKPLWSRMDLLEDLMPTAIQKLTSDFTKFWYISVTRSIENGATISFWHHDWGMGIIRTRYADLYSFVQDDTQTVAEVLHTQIQLRNPISESAANQLNSLNARVAQINLTTATDGARWRWSENGVFSVKSAYQAIKNTPRIANNRMRIWNLKALPRFRVFGWLMIMNRILTIDNLRRREDPNIDGNGVPNKKTNWQQELITQQCTHIRREVLISNCKLRHMERTMRKGVQKF